MMLLYTQSTTTPCTINSFLNYHILLGLLSDSDSLSPDKNKNKSKRQVRDHSREKQLPLTQIHHITKQLEDNSLTFNYSNYFLR